MKDEPLHRLACAHSLAGRSFAEVGIVLKHAVVETKLPLGKVVEKVRSTSVGQAATEIPPEVLPLPLSVTTAEKYRLLTLLMCGTFNSDVSLGFQKTIHTASINDL